MGKRSDCVVEEVREKDKSVMVVKGRNMYEEKTQSELLHLLTMRATSMTTGLSHRSGCPVITDLEEPIMMGILSRLPLKTIIGCKCVCKTWFRILLDPHFAKIHFSRSPTQIFGTYDDYPYIAELDESLFIRTEGRNEDIRFDFESMSHFTKFPYPLDNNMEVSLVNVANGFAFFCDGLVDGCGYEWEPCNICNPITGEHIVVQQTEWESCKLYMLRLGFSKINELKIIRVVCDESYDFKYTSTPKWLEADIYRLSTNSWTNIGKLPYNELELDGHL